MGTNTHRVALDSISPHIALQDGDGSILETNRNLAGIRPGKRS